MSVRFFWEGREVRGYIKDAKNWFGFDGLAYKWQSTNYHILSARIPVYFSDVKLKKKHRKFTEMHSLSAQNCMILKKQKKLI